MTTQEYLFCESYYLNGKNGYLAAIEAGYPEQEAENVSKKLLSRPDIKEEIRQYGDPVRIDPLPVWTQQLMTP